MLLGMIFGFSGKTEGLLKENNTFSKSGKSFFKAGDPEKWFPLPSVIILILVQNM